jgi:dephospho-CoA kinase
MLIALALTGKIGSGKTAVTTAIAKALNWPRASFGDYVRAVAREQDIAPTRQSLQKLGTELLNQDPKQFCASVLSSSGWVAPGNLVIDGLRHRETVALIRDLVRPALLKIVLIQVSEPTRLTRVREREGIDLQSIAAFDSHSSEAQVTSGLYDVADLVIDGEQPLAETVGELSRWIEVWKHNNSAP